MIDKAKYDSFYVPMYGPSKEELEEIIQDQGSISISEVLVDEYASGVDSTLITPSRYANQLRAALEPLIVEHFGEVMDEFVRIAERRWSVEGSLQDALARSPKQWRRQGGQQGPWPPLIPLISLLIYMNSADFELFSLSWPPSTSKNMNFCLRQWLHAL